MLLIEIPTEVLTSGQNNVNLTWQLLATQLLSDVIAGELEQPKKAYN